MAPGAEIPSPALTPAIVVERLCKTFRVPQHQPATLKERALHPFRRIPKLDLEAAKDISFSVGSGEFFGIVGRNGSGKSTLLTLLTGIYQPDSGAIDVKGRVSPLIALGIGFNPEMAARDNVLVNGAMLGLRRNEILARFNDIIEFAGLEEFTELKLKNYSSGMLVRLAFATAIQVDADVLLLDEVLAVGDAGFQEKCFAAFRRLKDEGKTIVLVTHGMSFIRRFCDRAIMLEEGEIVAEGAPEEVAERYQEVAAAEGETAQPDSGEAHRFGDGAATVVDTWVENSSGERLRTVRQGERIALAAAIEFHQAMESPVFGMQLYRETGEMAFASNTLWDRLETPRYEAGDEATFRVELDNRLGVGTYTMTPGVAHRDGTHPADIRFGLGSFAVRGDVWTGATADLPHRFEIGQGTSAGAGTRSDGAA